MPSKCTDSKSNMTLMNAMCDMSQFVIVVPVSDEVKFGLYHLVVLDDGALFKGSFVVMCKVLDLNYDILAKCNHKGLSVELVFYALPSLLVVNSEFSINFNLSAFSQLA